MSKDEIVTEIIRKLTLEIRKRIDERRGLVKERNEHYDLLKDTSIPYEAYISFEKEKETLEEQIVVLDYEIYSFSDAREICFEIAEANKIKLGEI